MGWSSEKDNTSSFMNHFPLLTLASITVPEVYQIEVEFNLPTNPLESNWAQLLLFWCVFLGCSALWTRQSWVCVLSQWHIRQWNFSSKHLSSLLLLDQPHCILRREHTVYWNFPPTQKSPKKSWIFSNKNHLPTRQFSLWPSKGDGCKITQFLRVQWPQKNDSEKDQWRLGINGIPMKWKKHPRFCVNKILKETPQGGPIGWNESLLGVIPPVTHLFSAIYRGEKLTSIYSNNYYGAHLVRCWDR